MASRTKLTVAYLGGGFAGWQRQTSSRTVQGELERGVTNLTGGPRVPVIGAGRTDAGVHAAGQVAHVDLPDRLPVAEAAEILNARLPDDVRIRAAVAVGPAFHARFDAVGKHYSYRVRWHGPELPWRGLRAAVDRPPEHPGLLEAACRMLPGRRDWASFTTPDAARRGAVRTVSRVVWTWRRDGLDLGFFGDGFVRYQIRRMVGALLAVGHAKMTLDEIRTLLESASPGAPVSTADARGLTLERVYYRRAANLSLDRFSEPAGDAGSLW